MSTSGYPNFRHVISVNLDNFNVSTLVLADVVPGAGA